MAHQLVGGDAHKARGQAALWREGLARSFRQPPDHTGDSHVLGQIKVMQVLFRRYGGDPFVEEIGQAGDDRIHRVREHVRTKRRSVRGIQAEGLDRLHPVGPGYRPGQVTVDVCQLYAVVPGFP